MSTQDILANQEKVAVNGADSVDTVSVYSRKLVYKYNIVWLVYT